MIYDRPVLDRWIDELAGLISGAPIGAGPGAARRSGGPPEKALVDLPKQVKLPYVDCRVDRSGAERRDRYRRGYIRLPYDSIGRIAAVQRLNVATDPLSSIIPRQRRIPGFELGHSETSQTVPTHIEALGPALPFPFVTRRAVVDFIKSYEKAFQRRQSAAVLKNLFKLTPLSWHRRKRRDRWTVPENKSGPRDGFGPMTSSPNGSRSPLPKILPLRRRSCAGSSRRGVRQTFSVWPGRNSGSAIRLRQEKVGAARACSLIRGRLRSGLSVAEI